MTNCHSNLSFSKLKSLLEGVGWYPLSDEKEDCLYEAIDYLERKHFTITEPELLRKAIVIYKHRRKLARRGV